LTAKNQNGFWVKAIDKKLIYLYIITFYRTVLAFNEETEKDEFYFLRGEFLCNEKAVEVPCLRKVSETKGQFVNCSKCDDKKVWVLGETAIQGMLCLACIRKSEE